MYYGGDYNPEQWPEDVWVDDIRLMREARVNLVSLGIFAWARIQPEEGAFDFDWLDRVLDLLHEGGIGANLATATASPPPWATHRYPEMLPQDRAGSTLWHGSRQAYAPTSPVYRRLAGELVEAIAGRYAEHPAVQMWHVNNEYGCHLELDYSDNAAVAFRDWLRDRYGSVDSLNDAWGTSFWSQTYSDFEEIVPPRLAPYSVNPAGALDFRRFSSQALLDLFRMEKSILRSAGARQPITTNFMGAFSGANYHEWAAEVDLIADDSYPDPADPESFRAAAFTRDLMRSLKPGVPWVLMEQATNAVNWRPSNASKAPGQMAALSMQAVARGADGIMFFQWRQSRAGSEKFHSAMVPHAGTDTRTWRETAELGSRLQELPVLSADCHASVAVLYDWESTWAQSAPDHPVEFDGPAVVQEWYAAIHRAHVTVDIRHPSDDLSGYAAVVAPNLYLLTADSAANLSSYVASGGVLLLTAFSDVVDEHDRLLDGGFTTRLADVVGLQVQDFNALPLSADHPWSSVAVRRHGGGTFAGRLFAEELTLAGAEVLGVFDAPERATGPAFTRHAYGSGHAFYVATVPERAGMSSLLDEVFGQAGVLPVLADLPEQVEVVRRDHALFAINHGPTAVKCLLPQRGSSSGAEQVELEAHSWVVVDAPPR